jgi:hypothetical protein
MHRLATCRRPEGRTSVVDHSIRRGGAAGAWIRCTRSPAAPGHCRLRGSIAAAGTPTACRPGCPAQFLPPQVRLGRPTTSRGSPIATSRGRRRNGRASPAGVVRATHAVARAELPSQPSPKALPSPAGRLGLPTRQYRGKMLRQRRPPAPPSPVPAAQSTGALHASPVAVRPRTAHSGAGVVTWPGRPPTMRGTDQAGQVALVKAPSGT